MILNVANTGPLNAVVSGLFFDTAPNGPVAAPTFSVPGGSYSTTQQVSLSTTTAGASIRYTTDGVTTPTETIGTLYVSGNPITVSSTTTIKAIAYASGMTDSTVSTATYTINMASGNGATFVRVDSTTKGSWKGVYGTSGYNVINDTISYPAFVTVTPAGQASYTWSPSTGDLRALQKEESTTDRIAATWYTSGSYTIDLNFNDGAQHQVAVYCLDWDSQGRAENISVLDGATHAVLDTRSAASFQSGQYLVWNVSGHVILNVANTGPVNAVVSGLFFD